MEDITAMADRLGKAIADCPQAKALEQARKALRADAETMKVLQAHEEQARKIARLEAEQKPIEVEDKHKLEDLRGRLIAADAFKKYTAAQVEFVDLMRKVNQAIHKHLAPAEPQTPQQ